MNSDTKKEKKAAPTPISEPACILRISSSLWLKIFFTPLESP